MILERFSEYSEHTKFDMVGQDFTINRRKFNYEPEAVHANNYKFAVIVPHTFIDSTEGNTKTFESFSYSFTQNSKQADPPYFMATSIAFEFSPVTMMITKENKPFSKFVINLCAIVGGVFVVFGMFNSNLQASKRSLRGE